jgi:hypothetical protein
MDSARPKWSWGDKRENFRDSFQFNDIIWGPCGRPVGSMDRTEDMAFKAVFAFV